MLEGPWPYPVVAVAGFLAGAVNAVAGGGTLISFPALLLVGVAPIPANITSSVGLVSGYVGSAVGYRRELADQRPRVRALAPVAVLGGVLGAALLLVTPGESFRVVVPYLVLLSCTLLAAQPRLARWVTGRGQAGPDRPGDGTSALPTRLGVLVASVYGSYFGAGLGVLLLALLGTFVRDTLQRLNGLKSVLSFVVNVVGVLVFVFSGAVVWRYAAVLFVGSYLGGVAGARLARRLPGPVLRSAVVVLGVVVAGALIVRG